MGVKIASPFNIKGKSPHAIYIYYCGGGKLQNASRLGNISDYAATVDNKTRQQSLSDFTQKFCEGAIFTCLQIKGYEMT